MRKEKKGGGKDRDHPVKEGRGKGQRPENLRTQGKGKKRGRGGRPCRKKR